MKKVWIVIGSTRPNRIGRQVAEWVSQSIAGSGPGAANFETELVDLAEWSLPILDEPGLPSGGEYAREHTRAWSRKIAEADGFIFVTPQYNWGYPASLKNALDHLFKEWNNKSAVIVSYGYHGGGKAAAQLRQVLGGLRMRPTATMPAITFSHAMLGEDGHLRDTMRDFAPYVDDLAHATAELAALLQDREQRIAGAAS